MSKKPNKMAKSSALQLGRAVEWPKTPDEAQIDRVPNPQSDTDYLVRFTAPEFTSICPVTGQPDSGAGRRALSRAGMIAASALTSIWERENEHRRGPGKPTSTQGLALPRPHANSTSGISRASRARSGASRSA